VTGTRISDPVLLERLRELTIPPAWRDVWICPDPSGHLQATGVDAAGRKQYLYHPRWREGQDRKKFAKMLRFADALPGLRQRIALDLQGDELSRTRVLACAARLLDIGLFRIGSEEYAAEEHGVGLATLLKEHLTVRGGVARFDYRAKAGVRRIHEISDPQCVKVLQALRRRRGGGEQLLAFRARDGWHPVRSSDINDYLKEHMGEDFSAKDFRTWNASVLAAVALALEPPVTSRTARRRAVNRAIKGVAAMLGNTPAVARRSYVDPRVIDRYQSGWTIGGAVERVGDLEVVDEATRHTLEAGVVDLLTEETESAALEQVAA
jgi:DNA topoisomerase-1